MEPSSSDTGFFQELPELRNQFFDDVSFQRVLKLLVPADLRQQVEPELAQLGADVLEPRIFDYITDAERNLPYLRGGGHNAFGRPMSELVTGEGWRSLQAFGIEKGIVAYNYTTDYGAHSRLLQMMRFHLWEASAASTTCPGAMTDGAARLLQRHLTAKPDRLEPVERRVFQAAFERLTSLNPAGAWTSGQWMTERPGGSDVSQTETVATYVGATAGGDDDVDANGDPLGPWAIDGFKWFSSATDAGMAILLARTHSSKGLSAFFAPMRRRRRASSPATAMAGPNNTELNGVRIQRLKDKFGTRPVPTAELELRGTRAWLIGREGDGIREIATMLAITRVHCSVACLGLAGRALGVAKAYALVRHVSGGPGGRSRMPLYKSPLHMRTLADLTGEYHGMMLLTMYTAYIMGSLHKAYCCKQAVPLLHGACMEALGGVGYLLNHETEPLNLARLFRDGCVNAIWEGTTDVLSTDLLRTLTSSAVGPASLNALDWLVTITVSSDSNAVRQSWTDLRLRIEAASRDGAARESLLADARNVLFSAADILIAGLLLVDARSDSAPEAAAMSRRFLAKKGFVEQRANLTAQEGFATDVTVVYGQTGPEARLDASAKL
ncbi:acyl-dehydrogenase domain containing protein [Grosmannia clavigera kw1407]|uniref:Acyl-dehydrogenase domain containing protein n=1 Tax=Grosmannia clavigera (strain kw1407 / UAMH 11150) TaxID=655863 RepID=F0XLQ6_GROCL|nr:acyl-dehydrogenase domain containing protein [Grosmannia clavigera kw1407]EFX01121.1 acyl-dehydrogenase domain containing protein [Grosmannia clavigera kw1407]